MKQYEVVADLVDGKTRLKLTGQSNESGMVFLNEGYVLTGHKLWKRKGNVLCGEIIEYKEISIKIKKF